MLTKQQRSLLFGGMAVAGCLILLLTSHDFWHGFGLTLGVGSLLYLAVTNLPGRRGEDG